MDVYLNQPGQMYRKWTQTLGKTFRIKAALGVGPPSPYMHSVVAVSLTRPLNSGA